MNPEKCTIREQYTYDNLGRLSSKETINGQQIFYSYDATGNLIRLQVNPEVSISNTSRSLTQSIPEQSPPSIANVPPLFPGFPPVPPPVTPGIVGNGQTPPPMAAPVLPPIPVVREPLADATVIQSRLVKMEVVVLDGMLKGQHFPLGDQFRVGRDPDNDLVLPDQKASRHHLLIQRQDNQYQIVDLNSSNGTFVNNKEIHIPTMAKQGDVILVGDTKLSIGIQA